MDAILKYLREHPRQVFADELDRFSGPPPKKSTASTARESWRMFAAGKSFEQIAQTRGLSPQTIVKHVADAIEAGEPYDAGHHFTPAQQKELETVFAKLGDVALGPIKETLGERYDYPLLHLFRALRRARNRAAS
jgi:ATP-dependent DNA helicase RecQ